MTSDAKIGLLLGLVFVVVIAFLLNGLPGLIGKAANGHAVNTSITATSDDYGITDQAGQAVNKVRDFMPLNFPARDAVIGSSDPRFSGNPPVVANGGVSEIGIASGTESSTVRTYVVKPGDNLGKIARKVYGDKVGNKHAMVNKIFKANAGSLNNPDDIYVGQKLIIPVFEDASRVVKKPLDDKRPESVIRVKKNETAKRSGEEVLIESGMFEKVSNAFKNIFSESQEEQPALQRQRIYVVKDGDSLWEIAAKMLGSGTRHKEILRINSLQNADDLKVGMKLKLPVN